MPGAIRLFEERLVPLCSPAYRDAEGKLSAARTEIETAARDREWLEHAVAELTGVFGDA